MKLYYSGELWHPTIMNLDPPLLSSRTDLNILEKWKLLKWRSVIDELQRARR
jgi:hypothetical protein